MRFEQYFPVARASEMQYHRGAPFRPTELITHKTWKSIPDTYYEFNFSYAATA